jgi:hypothetical protein
MVMRKTRVAGSVLKVVRARVRAALLRLPSRRV